ncbi:MAG: reductive dehalogenase domain-containing protein [Marinilabiliales bacterium]
MFENIVNTAFWGSYIIFFLFLVFAIIVSFNEKESKAAIKIFSFLILITFVYIPFIFIDTNTTTILKALILLLLIIALLFFFIPYKKNVDFSKNYPQKRYDERKVIFSRMLLKNENAKFKTFYNDYPELKDVDKKIKELPGLLSSQASLYNKYLCTATDSFFSLTEFCREKVSSNKSKEKTQYDNHKIIKIIHELGRINRIHSIGITTLKNYHLYSIRGRGKDYGKEVIKTHKTAIVFTVEMDKKMISYAPQAPAVLESSNKYLHAATFAITLADFINKLGYDARAHIDGDYELICPLVARDAGLGEIGRMGILITPDLGPRVRIAAVTTEMQLPENKYKPDASVINFCNLCKKCANNCPSKAISFNNREIIDGALRWTINMEKCYTYWCKTGTDCGRCVSVCPYSHENNLLHMLIRKAIRNNYNFLKLAVKMDDYLYSKYPKIKKSPF